MSHIMLSFTSVPLVKAEMKPHNLYDATHTLEDFLPVPSFSFLSSFSQILHSSCLLHCVNQEPKIDRLKIVKKTGFIARILN